MIYSIGEGGRPDCLAPIPQTLAKLETMTEEEKQRWRENKAARVQSQRATVQEKRERLRQVCLGLLACIDERKTSGDVVVGVRRRALYCSARRSASRDG